MGEKIVVGPINKGFRNDREPFVIDNDSFPLLINAYQWRGRVKRKRGTAFLTHLQRQQVSVVVGNTDGAGNFLSVLSALMGLGPNATIVPGTFIAVVGGVTFTEPSPPDGTLLANGVPAGGGTFINYATTQVGLVTGIAAIIPVVLTFFYYPNLPVMGLRDLLFQNAQYPGTLGFDTTFSYNITTTEPYRNYDVSFYKNPTADGTIRPGYVPKTTWTPTTWNGEDYRQFWTENYQNAIFTTNGMSVPFNTLNISMQFKHVTNIAAIVAGPPATATFTIPLHGLVKGDFLFFNEFNTATVTGLNFQTGYVINVVDPNNVDVEFYKATLGGAGGATGTGIAQYLTNRSDVTKDCLRWYDGDPTNGDILGPIPSTDKGWVNFAPPLSQSNFSIAELDARQYYLVGARMIRSFKDRLVFFGPVVQASSGGSIYLQDTIVYSQNGTAFYTASFTGDPSLPNTVFYPILVPTNQTATVNAYWADQTGFGGFITAGVDEPICTTSSNEDVIIVGFDGRQTQMVYTGNDIVPFNLFTINSEYGSSSTFSSINMDKGVITRGNKGFISTGQTEAARIDLEIPDEVFQIRLTENGSERVTAQRDFLNEWIYFTYPANYTGGDTDKFPNQTLQYNYRDNSWAIFRESYTTYGQFRKATGFTWATVGNVYNPWTAWNEAWNAGASTLEQREVIGGNSQGFVLTRDDGTSEGNSLFIKNIVADLVTSPGHTLNQGDFIVIFGAIGTVAQYINGKTFSVNINDEDTFTLNPPPLGSGTYSGNGEFKRLYVPMIQTKQFPASWAMAKKTRLGVQQYLLTTTQSSQIQLLIYLSQNNQSSYNDSPIVPDLNSVNNSLLYSTTLYTCPESTNLGLTPANVNLQMPTAIQQQQTWHRMNTSLIGDTIQIGFTMSDSQMRSLPEQGLSFAITGATQASRCVLTCASNFEVGDLVKITSIEGMIQLNYNPDLPNVYLVVAQDATTVTLEVDSTAFDPYISGGRVIAVENLNSIAEIELHGFILDVNPSQMLV